MGVCGIIRCGYCGGQPFEHLPYLREHYLPTQSRIEAGSRVALATDFSTGSAPSYHLHRAMTLAAFDQHKCPAEVLRGMLKNGQ